MWSKWSQCSVTCGGGLQQRSRNCTGPFYGGKVCDGIANDLQNCNNQNCPEDGVLSPWSTWGDCSQTCGGGVKERHRICIGPFYGGRYCEGVLVDNITCNSQDCPVDGILTSWTSWSQCSATCMGTQSRNRTCVGPFYGGKDCQSLLFESQPCNNVSCAVDGTWTVWSEWSPCSLSCGGGSRTRSRKCVGILNGGKNCDGNSEERQLCNSEGCPVDGFFGQWSSWGLCSLTCGSGIQLRNRTCIGPFNGGKNCSGNFEDSQTCNQQSCPIDGYYLQWSEWGVCSATCGGGVQYRNRTCVQPLYGGQNCQGVNSESQACSTNPCPVDGYYSEWGVWSQCSVSCGGGSYWRTRSCVPPKNGGLDCIGPANVTDSCNTQPCPIDGVWLSWSVWSACSTTCGGGKQTRTRLCEEPKYGGKLCEGPKAEYLNCSDNPCPIPGLWLPWSPWTPCSATCGGGTHVRDRLCNTTSFGNLTDPCPGSSRENASCHTFNCLPLARTCTELGQRGLVENTMADIDPDGPTLYSLEPVSVYCDMVSNNGTGVTVLGHNQEAKTEVQGWEGAREYQADLIYNVSFDHAISIVDQSSNCEQYIRWECFAALIHNYNDNNKITTGWLNRTKGVADYFGDAPPGSNNCTCGTKNACADKSFGCNCDSNDHVWRVDDGYLTYKDDLPVYAFVAGDTGGSDEEGFSTVGPLRCWGSIQKSP
ncbi:SCO-spondin [Biomphalaria glabrata]|nr:SCO-spondin-like [Biomphalaria glabrata]